MSETAANTVESEKDERGKGKAALVRMWLNAISLASKEEEGWRDNAAEAVRHYRGEDKHGKTRERSFNILYSNVETTAPAIYNSRPNPDVRRRYGDDDPLARMTSTALERALSYSIDMYPFDQVMRRAVKDILIVGRAVVRVKYDAQEADGMLAYERVTCETVNWANFRHGPARVWNDVPWVAFRHFLTRDELARLSPRIGPRVDLDARVEGADDKEGPVEEIFQRGTVWEIWDRDSRRVLFVAPAWSNEPLLEIDDPLGLDGFFPVAEPIYAVDTPDTLIPIEPYRLYKTLAEELDRLTQRIGALTKAIKWRGAYSDPQVGDFLARFEKLDDGEFAGLDNAAMMANGQGMDKAFWLMPIAEAAGVLQQLYVAREQVKATIYEVTGISDIVRGASVASETATAQQIKSQWGSLRIQRLQAEVQRFARDLMRLKAEIIATRFQPETLMAMTGQQLPPDAVMLLRDDAMRSFRVDIETDSTIQADVMRAQQNAQGFIAGFGGFVQAVGPAVQQGALPMEVVTTMIKSFARTFKLGRDVEAAIDSIGQQAMAPSGQDKAAQEQAKAQAEMQARMQAEAQKLQVQAQADQQKLQAQMEMKRLEIEAEDRRHAATLQLEREKAFVQAQAKVAPAVGINLGADTEAALGSAMQQLATSTAASAEATAQAARASEASAQAMVQAASEIAAASRLMAAPKRVVRGPDGRALGVEPVPVN